MAKKIQIPIDLVFKGKMDNISSIINNIRNSFANLDIGKNSSLSGLDKSIENFYKAFSKVQNTKLDTSNLGTYQKAVNSLEEAYNQLSISVENAQKKINAASTKEKSDAVKNAELVLSNLGKKYAPEGTEDTINFIRQLNAEQARSLGFSDEEVKIRGQAASVVTRYNNEQQKLLNQTQEERNQINAVNQLNQTKETVLQGLNQRTEEAIRSQQELNREESIDAIKQKIKYYTSWAFSISIVRQQLQKMVQTYKDIDKSITAISMASGISRESLWGDIGQYNQLAKDLGTTTTEVLNASKLYYQQGLATNDVIELTTQSLRLAAIAETDAATATDYMTVAINGYKLAAEDAEMVTDTWSALAAKTAVDVEELAIAISKVASISQSAGMDIQSTSAFLTQIISTTREAPETAGTALKTVIARFQELKTEVDELEDGVSANKVEQALKSADVALRDASGQFRNFDDVIIELSSKWDDLDRNTQRYIATIAAGSRQQSRFIALVDDYDGLMQNLSYAQDSAGASTEQFTVYTEGLEASTNRLTASWEGFYTSLSSGSNIITGVIDGLSSLLNTATKIGPGLTLGLGLALTQFTRLAVNSLAAGKSLKDYWTTTSKLGQATQNLIAKLGTENSILSKSKTLIDTIASSQRALTAIKSVQNTVDKQGLTTKEAENVLVKYLTKSLGQETAAKIASTFATKGETAAIKELIKAKLASMAANPVGRITIIIALIAALVGILSKVIKTDKERLKELQESNRIAQEYQQTVQNTINTYSSYLDSLEEVKSGEKDLSDVRDDLIAQYGPYLEGVNLETASYQELAKAIEAARKAEKTNLAMSRVANAREKLEEEGLQASEDFKGSDAFDEYVVDQEERIIDEGIRWQYNGKLFDDYDELIDYITSEIKQDNSSLSDAEISYQANQIAMNTTSGFIGANDTLYDDPYSAAYSLAQAYADGLEKSILEEGVQISSSDAELIVDAIGKDFGVQGEEQGKLLAAAIQRGVLEFDADYNDEGEMIAGTFRLDEESTKLSTEEIAAGLDELEELAQKHEEVQQLFAGEIGWNQLSNETLNIFDDLKGAAAQFVDSLEAEYKLAVEKTAAMRDAAGLNSYDEESGMTETAYLKGFANLRMMDNRNINESVKQAFLTSFNELGNDPQAQEAFSLAINNLLKSGIDPNIITSEMITAFSDQESMADAFKNLLGFSTEELEENGMTGYASTLVEELGYVESAYITATKATEDFYSAQNDLASLEGGMDMEEYVVKIKELAQSLEGVNGLTAQQIELELWAATAYDETGTAYLETTDNIEGLIDGKRRIEFASLDEAIAAKEAAASEIESIADAIEAKAEQMSAGETVNKAQLAQLAGVTAAGNVAARQAGEQTSWWKRLWDAITGKGVDATGAIENGTDEVLSASEQAFNQAISSYESGGFSKGDLYNIANNLRGQAGEIRVQIAQLESLKNEHIADSSGGGGGSSSSTDSQKEYINSLKNVADKLKEVAENAADAAEAQIEAILSVLEIQKAALEEENEDLEKSYEERQDIIVAWFELEQERIEKEIESLEEANDLEEENLRDRYDQFKEFNNLQIEAIQDKIDALDEEDEAQNRLLELQKARDEYERARTSKNRLVLVQGAGWIFKTNQTEIDEAQEALEEAEKEYQKAVYEAQIEELEAQAERWDKIAENIGKSADELQRFADAFAEYNAMSDDEKEAFFQDFANAVGEHNQNKSDRDEQLEDLNAENEKIEELLDKFQTSIDDKIQELQVQEYVNSLRVAKAMEDNNLTQEAWDALSEAEKEALTAAITNDDIFAMLEEDGNELIDKVLPEIVDKINKNNSEIEKLDEAIELWEDLKEDVGLSLEELKEAQDLMVKYQALGLEGLDKNSEEYKRMEKYVREEIAKMFSDFNAAQKHYEEEKEKYDASHSSGGVVDYTGTAKLHGSSNNPEVVFNSRQAAALFNWVKSLPSMGFPSIGSRYEFAKDNTVTTNNNNSININNLNITSNANSLERLVSDIREKSPLIRRK